MYTSLNSNIRCIEIFVDVDYFTSEGLLNSNIRCIEICPFRSK